MGAEVGSNFGIAGLRHKAAGVDCHSAVAVVAVAVAEQFSSTKKKVTSLALITCMK